MVRVYVGLSCRAKAQSVSIISVILIEVALKFQVVAEAERCFALWCGRCAVCGCAVCSALRMLLP